MLAVAVTLLLAGVTASWLARRQARRRNAWLRSDVPDGVAYARLRAEIERHYGDAERARRGERR